MPVKNHVLPASSPIPDQVSLPDLSHLLSEIPHIPLVRSSSDTQAAADNSETRTSPSSEPAQSRTTVLARFICPKCDFKGSSERLFGDHMRISHGVNWFKCDDCGKSMARSDNLKAHHQKCRKRKQVPVDEQAVTDISPKRRRGLAPDLSYTENSACSRRAPLEDSEWAQSKKQDSTPPQLYWIPSSPDCQMINANDSTSSEERLVRSMERIEALERENANYKIDQKKQNDKIKDLEYKLDVWYRECKCLRERLEPLLRFEDVREED